MTVIDTLTVVVINPFKIKLSTIELKVPTKPMIEKKKAGNTTKKQYANEAAFPEEYENLSIIFWNDSSSKEGL
jgi:hypothetical protein